jgi:SAM-dependent methyltransferase
MDMLFEKFADNYSRFRPGYPDDLVSSLISSFDISRSSLVLDLACGAGKLGRSIAAHSQASIIGLDHSLILLQTNSMSGRINAEAETLPLASGSFDAVVVGQAFHWFDFPCALAEISRVFKPGGGFAIVWYHRRRPLDGYRLKMDELIHRLNPDYKIVFMDYDWPAIIAEHGGFARAESFETEWVLEYSIADYLKLQQSKSYIGDALTPDLLAEFNHEYEKILKADCPDGIVKEKLQYYYVSAIKT